MASDAREARAGAARSASGSGAERERQLRFGHCQGIGCGDVLPLEKLFCEKHERMLRPDVLTHLMRKYRPGKTPSKVFTFLLACAVKDVLFYQTAGHHVPKPSAFEFDDTPTTTETPRED